MRGLLREGRGLYWLLDTPAPGGEGEGAAVEIGHYILQRGHPPSHMLRRES